MSKSIDIIRIVVVDDHPIVRAGIHQILRQATDIVIAGECEEGYDAITLILKLQPTVVVLDMNLPDISGLEVLRQLKASGYSGSFLVLSAYNDKEHILEALKQGVAGYLTKDEASTTLVKAIREIARGEVGWLSRRVTAQLIQDGFLTPSQHDALPHQSDNISLSNREIQVLQEIANGSDNRQIAQKFALSEGTVKNHITTIYGKIGVRTRAEAVTWAWRHNLVHIDLRLPNDMSHPTG